MRDGPALRPDHPGPRGQITRGSGHSRAGQGDLRETGEESPPRVFMRCAGIGARLKRLNKTAAGQNLFHSYLTI